MLNPHVPTFVFTLINLAVLYLLLKKLFFKPVTRYMDNRAKAIRASFEEAEKVKADALKLKEDYEQKLKAVKSEADAIILDARNRASDEYRRIVEEAKREGERIKANALKQVELEKKKMQAEIRDQAASLAIDIASRLLEVNLNTEANRKMVDGFLDEADAAGTFSKQQ